MKSESQLMVASKMAILTLLIISSLISRLHQSTDYFIKISDTITDKINS